MTEYTSAKDPVPVVRGANQVVGQVGLVRASSASWTDSGRSTVQPSAICRTGPRPATRFTRNIVQGMPPRVRKSVLQPPPGKYSVMEAHHRVAARQFSASSGAISHHGLTAGSP